MQEKNQVVKSKILNEAVNVSVESCHEYSLHDSFKDHFDSMQEELLFGQPYHDKQVIEYFEICHAFYDPVVEYMDRFFRWRSWLCFCNKRHTFHHNLFPFCSYVPISIKHKEET